MKTIFIGILALAATTISSCKNCVDCTGVAGQQYNHYCKSDYKTQTGSEDGWISFRNALKASGCKGVN